MFGVHNPSKLNFLVREEAERLLHHAKTSQNGLRDHAMMLLAYRHGLRVSELVEALRSHANVETGQLWIERKMGGLSANQPLTEDEVCSLQAYLDTREDSLPWLFVSNRGTRMVRSNFNYLIARASERAGLGKLHPNILRDSCNFVIVAKGTDTQLAHEWLGRRFIQKRNFQKAVGPRRGKS